MNKIAKHYKNTEAWVVFSDETDLPWLRFLKPGFRHCYVLLREGERWVSIDPMSNYTDINIHPIPSAFDLPLWLADRGLKIIKAPISRIKKQAPVMPFTCVEAVKRILGVHSRFIFTPWQLYRHLTKQTQLVH